VNKYLQLGLIFYTSIGISFLLLYIRERFYFKKLLKELEEERKENDRF